MNEKKIKVTLRSTFAIAGTNPLGSIIDSNQDAVIELDEGATIESMLLSMHSIGNPRHWDDIMLIAIVNGTLRGFDHVLADKDVIHLHIPVSGG
jgi:molybdopterin converting factor small subunit